MISLEEAVLVAVAAGAETADSVASALRVEKSEVERAAERLVSRGLLRVEERGWWLLRRRVLLLTAEGFEAASRAFRRLTELASRIREKLEEAGAAQGRAQALEPYLGVGYLLPLLVWLGLLDMALLGHLAAAGLDLGAEEVPDVDSFDTDFA